MKLQISHFKFAAVALCLGIFAVAGSAQAIPCLVNTARLDPSQYTPPVWDLRPAAPAVLKIAAGSQWIVPVQMPVRGTCSGSFASYDDRDDLAVAVTDAAGRYIRQKPQGDIELVVLDTFGLEMRNANRSYAAIYSSGRSFGGTFAVDLGPGIYFFVLSNKHSYLAAKSVNFTLGKDTPTP